MVIDCLVCSGLSSVIQVTASSTARLASRVVFMKWTMDVCAPKTMLGAPFINNNLSIRPTRVPF